MPVFLHSYRRLRSLDLVIQNRQLHRQLTATVVASMDNGLLVCSSLTIPEHPGVHRARRLPAFPWSITRCVVVLMGCASDPVKLTELKTVTHWRIQCAWISGVACSWR